MNTTNWTEAILKAFCFPTATSQFNEKLTISQINWEAVLENVVKHKLQPIFYKVLKASEQGKKAPIYPLLNAYQAECIRHSMFKLIELRRTVTAFKTADIKVTPYKGAAFAHSFYGDIVLRASVDVDMAIDLKDIPASYAIMRQLGYQEHSKEKEGGTSEKRTLHESRAYHIDYSWVLIENNKIICNIEFHWQPAHPVLQVPLRFDELPANAYTSIKIAGQFLPTFTKPYLALFTLIHHGLIDTWGQYRHLLDLMMMVKSMTAEEYLAFKQLLQQYQLLQSFYTGLYLLEQVFDRPISDRTYQAVHHQKIGQRLLVALRNNSLAGKWSDNPRKLLYHLQLRDTWLQQLKTGGSLMWFKLRFG